MTSNIHRRLTAGPAEDNIPALITAIFQDTMTVFERTADLAGELDTRTALAFLLCAALGELASYWPEPERRDPEFDAALLALRCELLPQLRGDAKPVEVLRHAAAELALARERAQAREAQPRYDWSPATNWPDGIVVATPSTTAVSYLGNDRDGDPILGIPVGDADDAEPVGVAVAEPDDFLFDWRATNQIIWAGVPAYVMETIESLETTEQLWADVDMATRMQIVRHIVATMDTPTPEEFDRDKPLWLPRAGRLAKSSHVAWKTLAAMTSPWA